MHRVQKFLVFTYYLHHKSNIGLWETVIILILLLYSYSMKRKQINPLI